MYIKNFKCFEITYLAGIKMVIQIFFKQSEVYVYKQIMFLCDTVVDSLGCLRIG